MLHDDDHRALGHRLGLFHLQEEAAGSVFWHPRGLQLSSEAVPGRNLTGRTDARYSFLP